MDFFTDESFKNKHLGLCVNLKVELLNLDREEKKQQQQQGLSRFT